MLTLLMSLLLSPAHGAPVKCSAEVTPPAAARILHSEREQALTLELSRIAPGTQSLAQLSHTNLERMIEQLRAHYPLRTTSTEISEKLANINKTLRMNFLRPARRAAGALVTGAELSVHAMQRLGIEPVVLPTSPVTPFASLEWEVVISDARKSLESTLQDILTNDKISLNETNTSDFAFVIPNLKSASDYFDFFDLWDPAVGEQVFAMNRASFPRPFVSYGEFRHTLVGSDLNAYFPSERTNEQLAPFHNRIQDYILSSQDSQTFIALALEHWAQFLYFRDADEAMVQLDGLTNSPAALRDVMNGRLLPFLFMTNGFVLRLPHGVSSTGYTIIRHVPPRDEIPRFGGFSGMRRMGGATRP